MKKIVLTLAVVIGLSMVFGGSLWAQELKFPQPSPKATVMQTVGLTDMTLVYSRPGVKDRTIWGDLVPMDKMWRLGANENTTIEFSTEVMIGETKVPAGKYGLFAIPGSAEWMFVLSKQNTLWGVGGYKDSEDVVRVKAKPMTAPFCERMLLGFNDMTDDSVKVYMHWEKVMVGFDVKVDTKGAIVKSLDRFMERRWRNPFFAARYAFGSGMVEKAKEYIDLSVSIHPIYWNMILKTQVYNKLAKTKKDKKMVAKLLEETKMSIRKLPKGQQGYAENNFKGVEKEIAGK